MDKSEVYLRNVLNESVWEYGFDGGFLFSGVLDLQHDKKYIAQWIIGGNTIYVEHGLCKTLRDDFFLSYMDIVTLIKNIFYEYYGLDNVIPMETQLNYPNMYCPSILTQ